VILRYGFMESPNIPRSAGRPQHVRRPFDPMQASYFLGREVLVRPPCQSTLVAALAVLVLARNATPATEFFRIPRPGGGTGVRVAI
jgi:KUP system potassium uptake protein